LAKFTEDLNKGFAHACSAVLAQRKIKKLAVKVQNVAESGQESEHRSWIK